MPIPSFTRPSKTMKSVTLNKSRSNEVDIFGDDNEELSDAMDSYSDNASNSSSGQTTKPARQKKTDQKGKTQIKGHNIDKINENEEIAPKNPELAPLLESRKIVDQDFAEFLPKRRNSKKSKEKEINLDVLNDYEAANLYKVMFQAADDDVKGIESKQPCIRKTDLLEDVVAQLSKPYLTEALLEHNILLAIKYWLEPLPDRSLPSITLIIEMLSLLDKYPITTDHLFASKIGRIVYFYTLTKRCPETIRQLATQLVEKWSRPILGLSDDYREVAVAHNQYYQESLQQQQENQFIEDMELAGSSNQDNFNLSRNISVRNKIPAIENLGVSKYYKKGLATTVNFNSNQTFSSDINSISSVQQQDDRENLQEIEDDADKLIDLADVVDNEVPNI
ncbi:12263_t:CDS:2 [Entrophospora sp. SA101]|nr:12263_t:CDS:2 [Entrophospora sp. SA101]